MSLLAWLTGKKNVLCRKAEGVDIVLKILQKFEDRTFTVKDGTYLYRAVSTVDLRTYIETKLPEYYNYKTQFTTYTDRIGKTQLHIILRGHIGLSSQLERYNPMDLKIYIKSKP